MLRLDHVVYAVRDLPEASGRFREAFGLDSVDGGRHEGWGTANRIVPLGDQYLELVAAVHESKAAQTAFGRGVLERAARGGGWFTIAAVADDLDAVATRLGLEVGSGSRTRPDGQIVRWRMAGLDDPRREAWMPFFLIWDTADGRPPGPGRAGHGLPETGRGGIEGGGDPERLRTWLGGDELPIRVSDGEPGI